MSVSSRTVLAALCASVAACVTHDGAPGPRPPRDAQTLARVFAPMTSDRAILCDELTVDLSAELWDRCSYPARSRFNVVRRDEGPPATWHFAAAHGGRDVPLRFEIGAVVVQVMQTATFRLHRKGFARLDFVARGRVVLSEKDRPPREVGVVEASAGHWLERGR